MSHLVDPLAIDPHDHRKKPCGHGEHLEDYPLADLDRLENLIFSPTPSKHPLRESPREDDCDGTLIPR
jgi:hypothetical protein